MADRSVSVLMTLSDLERRDTGVKFITLISLITLVPFDVYDQVLWMITRGRGVFLRGYRRPYRKGTEPKRPPVVKLLRQKCRIPKIKNKKLSCRWQTARRICANSILWLTSYKTRPSPYVLPCQIWSFWVTGCRHTYERSVKIWERCNSLSLSWDGRCAWPRPSPRVTTSNLVVLRQRMYG